MARRWHRSPTDHETPRTARAPSSHLTVPDRPDISHCHLCSRPAKLSAADRPHERSITGRWGASPDTDADTLLVAPASQRLFTSCNSSSTCCCVSDHRAVMPDPLLLPENEHSLPFGKLLYKSNNHQGGGNPYGRISFTSGELKHPSRHSLTASLPQLRSDRYSSSPPISSSPRLSGSSQLLSSPAHSHTPRKMHSTQRYPSHHVKRDYTAPSSA